MVAFDAGVNRTLIEDRRWLLRLFGAATLTPVLFFAAALAGALTWAGVRAGAGGAGAVVWVAVGVVYWTFVEYALHGGSTTGRRGTARSAGSSNRFTSTITGRRTTARSGTRGPRWWCC